MYKTDPGKVGKRKKTLDRHYRFGTVTTSTLQHYEGPYLWRKSWILKKPDARIIEALEMKGLRQIFKSVVDSKTEK